MSRDNYKTIYLKKYKVKNLLKRFIKIKKKE